MLEKTLESPLDCKEIKPLNPEGNQFSIFIGRTVAEAPILWPPDAKADSLKKTLMLGKTEGKVGVGAQGDMLQWHHQLNGHEFEQTPGDSVGQGSLVCCSPQAKSDMT